MKKFKLINFLIILLISNYTLSQDYDLTEKVNKSIRFGFSAGIENKFSKPHEAYLDPSTLTLEFDNLSRNSFVISTSIIYMPNYYYRNKNKVLDTSGNPKKDANGKEMYTYSDWEYKSGKWGGVVSLNVAEVSPDTGFNSRIDGGIGVAYAPGSQEKDEEGRYSPKPFYLSLTLDFSSIRQVKDGIKDRYEGQQILVNEEPLNALDQTDNSLFTNKVFAGISFKLIYLLN